MRTHVVAAELLGQLQRLLRKRCRPLVLVGEHREAAEVREHA